MQRHEDERDPTREERERRRPSATGDEMQRADHPEQPGVEDHIGEAAGGISGVLTGAAIGSLGGPVGTLIGGIAGAIGGWWAGKAIAEAALHFDEEEDRQYREMYESAPDRATDRPYDDVRPAYQLGHIASLNPEYAGRSFDEIEPHLQYGWTGEIRAQHGDWAEVRQYAREAYARRQRGREHEVRLSEESDPRALGDGTSITGYATGLDDTTEAVRERENAGMSAAERVNAELASPAVPAPPERTSVPVESESEQEDELRARELADREVEREIEPADRVEREMETRGEVERERIDRDTGPEERI